MYIRKLGLIGKGGRLYQGTIEALFTVMIQEESNKKIDNETWWSNMYIERMIIKFKGRKKSD